MPTFAIIETGGKQYRVVPGDTVNVDRLPGGVPGDTVNIEKVLLVSADGAVTLGRPLIAGAKVTATLEAEVKGEKLIIFRYKPKARERRKTGHRQKYTRLHIESIDTGAGQVVRAAKPPARKAAPAKEEATTDGS